MLIKYGKTVDMRNINRNMKTIGGMVEKARDRMEREYGEIGGGKPRCRICGSEQCIPFMKLLDKYDYYQCRRCESLFLGEIPDIQNLYCGEEAANSDSYIDDAVYEKRVEMISAPKIEFILDACHAEGIALNSWLDIGCGGGEILNWLTNNSDIRAEGIESDERECRFVRSKGLSVENCYIDLKCENSQISRIINRNDVISFFNVLEHMEDPQGFIDYICDNMHDDAVMVFEVPRYPSVASFANMAYCNIIYRHIAAPGHLQVFSEKSIAMLLQNKFRIIGKWEFGQGYTDLINNAMLMARVEENALYNKLIDLSNTIQAVFDKEGLADQILVVTMKI